MSKEAMKLAFEALETYYGYMEPLTTVFGGPRVPAEQSTTGKVETAITSLRQAIAEAEKQEPFGFAALDEVTEQFNSVNCGTVYRLPADGRSPLYTNPQPKCEPLTDERCTWRQHDDANMPDTWEADCGAMWTFTEGGPKDNNMRFCPNCGKPTIEAAHGIKE